MNINKVAHRKKTEVFLTLFHSLFRTRAQNFHKHTRHGKVKWVLVSRQYTACLSTSSEHTRHNKVKWVLVSRQYRACLSTSSEHTRHGKVKWVLVSRQYRACLSTSSEHTCHGKVKWVLVSRQYTACLSTSSDAKRQWQSTVRAHMNNILIMNEQNQIKSNHIISYFIYGWQTHISEKNREWKQI